jgi:hypothetical protein
MIRREVVNISSMMEDPDAYGSALLVALVDEFGTEFFSWEPDTLLLEIDAKWKVKPPVVNRDKIWSLVTCMTTNLFWKSLETFINVSHALNGHHANFEVFSPANVSEMSWALAEVALVVPPDPKEDAINEEIRSYMQLQLQEEGFHSVPRILSHYVKLDIPDSVINTNLDPEGIDYKAFFNDQQYKKLDVEEYVKKRMLALIQTIAAMPLRGADREAIQALQRRAQITLAGQSQQISSEAGTAPQKIAL